MEVALIDQILRCSYLSIACVALTLLSKSFSNLIITTIKLSETRRVDIAMEDRFALFKVLVPLCAISQSFLFRLDKCMRCKSEFLNALSILKEMNCTGSLRSSVLQATSLLGDFDDKLI